MRLSAVLPVLAEEDTVREIADGLVEGLGETLHEIILVVAGIAPEDTLRICAEVAERIPCARLSPQRKSPGLGLAVRQGIKEATGTHVLLMDSDGEMDVATVPLMVAKLQETGVDMVVASRWAPGGGVVGYDPIKYLLNRAFQVVFRILFRTRIRDLTLGFKICRADVMKALHFNAQFHDIGCETTLRPVRAGCTIAEVPTTWVCRKEGESSNPFRNNFIYLWKTLLILTEPIPKIPS
jgi:dolichol-phosphate mannosyltransferase